MTKEELSEKWQSTFDQLMSITDAELRESMKNKKVTPLLLDHGHPRKDPNET
jgi:hypothetical protein